MLFLKIWILPISLIVLSLYYAFKRRDSKIGRAAKFALLCFLLSLAVGTLLIFSSRSSTASVGIIFLPFYSLVPFVLGGLLGMTSNRIARWILILLILVCFGYLLSLIYAERLKNSKWELENQDRYLQIQNNRKWLNQLIIENPDDARKWVEKQVHLTDDDRWLIPIAESSVATAELLTELSKKPNAPMLSIIRNSKVPTSILEYAYRKTNYPDSYFADLAKQKNTPEDILIELYVIHRQKNSGIETSLASNPKIPIQLIPNLLKSDNPLVLGEIARNSAIDCISVMVAHKRLLEIDPKIQFHSTGLGWAKSGFERCNSAH